MALIINGTTYNFKPGYTATRLLNETLDSGLIIIPHTQEITIEPMDQVQLGTRYFYVATIRRRIASFSPVKTYNYELGLISPTIYLQRVILPNRSVTGTHKTIYDVMNEYRIIYAPTLIFSDELITRTNTVTCPEMQWTQPTLFEVYNDLLGAVGCVVTMPTFTMVSLLDLSTRGSGINESALNDDELTQSIEDYANELEIDAKNAVYPETNVQTYERLVLKTTQSSLLTVANSELILAKGIYNVDKLVVDFYNANVGSQSLDITDYVAEKTIYNAYKSSNSLSVIHDKDYKRNALYYTEGERIMGGFGYNEDGILGINSIVAMVNIVCDKLGQTPYDAGLLDANDILEFGFSVWYTSSEDIKFRVKKDNDEATGTIINNQESSHTDIRALAKSNQDTINRIGNPMRTIYGRYLSENDIPDIGDMLGDYVLTSQTVKYNADYFEFTGELTKNYVMKNMFTAIKNRKRYTQYESAREAFLSEHLTRYIVRATTTPALNYAVWETYLMMFAKSDNRLKVIVANITYNNDPSQEFLMNHSVHWLGNNVVRVNVKMEDNYSAGIRVERKTVFLVANRYSVLDTPYVDERGEFEAIELLLYKAFENPNFTASSPVIWRQDAIERARSYPLIDSGLSIGPDDIVFDTNLLYRYKDNREITSETLQFYFQRDSHVYIGDYYYRHNPLHYMGDTDIQLWVYTSNGELYTDSDYNMAKGTIVASVVRSANSIRAALTQEQWNNLAPTSWCVADGDGHVYFAVNGNHRYVYLVSNYNYNPINIDINDISISSVISADYVAGIHVSVDDVAIDNVVSFEYTKGNDAVVDDIEIESVVSYIMSAGGNVTINDINILETVSAEYTYNDDHFAITDINISEVLSGEYTANEPDNLSINDINIQDVVSTQYTANAPYNTSITDVNVREVLSAEYTHRAPTNASITDINVSDLLSTELTYDAPPYYEWQAGGTAPVGGSNCLISTDKNNVRCDITGYSCYWQQIDLYIAGTDETYNSGATCEEDVERTICTRISGTWYCSVELGTLQPVYGNCEICVEVDQ